MIEISSLRKVFEEEKARVTAVNKVSFTAPERKLFTLLGPSGCGKSTTSRCVAGLEKPDEGTIKIGQEKIFASQEKIFVAPIKRILEWSFNLMQFGPIRVFLKMWPSPKAFALKGYRMALGKSSRLSKYSS